MIPTLYNPTESAFTSNGIGKMYGATECTVTEEKNGIFDLEMKYATDALHYDALAEGCIIVSSHDDGGDLQPFRIREIKRGAKSATIQARHDAQVQLAGLPVWPYPSGSMSVSAVMSYLTTLAASWADDYPASKISFSTTYDQNITFNKQLPRYALEFLCGKEGSLVDLLGGGELLYDWKEVKLLTARGYNKHLRISYGKNISDITGETSRSECYTGAYLYYQGESGIQYAKVYNFDLGSSLTKYMPNVYEMDISSEFESAPASEAAFTAVADARAAALEAKTPWTNIYNNISVSWYELSQLSEYSHMPDRSVKLGDYVHVYYPAFGLEKDVEVVKTVWNPLRERYESLELNSLKRSLHRSMQDLVTRTIRRT